MRRLWVIWTHATMSVPQHVKALHSWAQCVARQHCVHRVYLLTGLDWQQLPSGLHISPGAQGKRFVYPQCSLDTHKRVSMDHAGCARLPAGVDAAAGGG